MKGLRPLRRRLYSSNLSDRQILAHAERSPNNADLQARLLEKWLEEGQYRRIRSRVESGLYAINQTAAAHYLKSMAELKKLDHVPFDTLAEHFVSGKTAPAPSSPSPQQSMPFSDHKGPVKVVLAPQKDPLWVKNVPNRWGQFFSFVLTGGILYIIYRTIKGNGSNDIFSMMKGTHQLAEHVTETFNDVIGLEEAKKEVRTLVDYLKNPSKYVDFGVTMPKGMLMFGPPGVGKTLLARAMAGEAQVPFFYISGSQIDEVFVGLGASRIRELFKDARKSAPSIIFIDEVDAIGGKRDFSGMGSGATSRQSLTQMLTLMDGFEEDAGVLVIAATNADENNLDKALLRSGRFDKKVYLHTPFRDDRKKLFQYYMSKVPHNVKDFEQMADHMASLTWGCSGADVANIVNQAGILAVNRNATSVTLDDLQEAHADVIMGPENQSMKTTLEDKRQTAAHEAGHVIVALYCPKATPPRQVTIKPRKNALGYMTKDVQDHVSQSKEGYLAEIAVAMGGRAAEELLYGEDAITSGAESDFAAATQIADAMVTHWGFSDELGPTHFDLRKEQMSEDTKAKVDQAIGSILEEGYERAAKILRDHKWEHSRLTESLFVLETMTQDEIKRVVKGERLHLMKDRA